jgi:hypothetical protein
MASTAAFHGLFNIEPTSSQVTSPPPAHQKSKDQDREIPSGINLKEYPSNQKKHGPTATPSSAQALPQPSSHVHPSSNADGDTDLTPSQLELSRPASPTVGEATGQMQRWDDPPINRWRVLSCCLIYFHNGMNDSGTSQHCREPLITAMVTDFSYSDWCFDPIHGEALPHWLRSHVANLRRSGSRLYRCCFL